jgi:hypothetical protein
LTNINQKLAVNEKHFKKCYFNNTAITELEEITFFEITFKNIEILKAKNLSLINTHAFTSTNKVTKFFNVNQRFLCLKYLSFLFIFR